MNRPFSTTINQFRQEPDLRIAIGHLEQDDPIAVPTDTVYGLVARYNAPDAIRKIYEIKERPLSKALPVLLGDIGQLSQVAGLPDSVSKQAASKFSVDPNTSEEGAAVDHERRALWPSLLNMLAERWWPGPLTMVLPARDGLPSVLTAGAPTIAVRIPAHDLLQQLIRQTGPLAGTSANLSGAPEATTASDAFEQLAGRVPAIFDGGPSAGGVASTIIDLSDIKRWATGESVLDAMNALILRSGPIGPEIKKAIADHCSTHQQ